jgi:hypothetical protein
MSAAMGPPERVVTLKDSVAVATQANEVLALITVDDVRALIEYGNCRGRIRATRQQGDLAAGVIEILADHASAENGRCEQHRNGPGAHGAAAAVGCASWGKSWSTSSTILVHRERTCRD